MSEIEIKLLLTEEVARGLWPRARKARIASGRQTTRTLRSMYWDTAGHALRDAGIALRLRRDGRRWVQTVKCGRSLQGGLSVAEEIEIPAPGGRLNLSAIPDEAVRDRILELVEGAPLQPVCQTTVRRTAGLVAMADGTRAELAVDACSIDAAGRTASFIEAEIELIDGSPGRLFDVAELLLPPGSLRFSRLAKSARGYLLAEKGVVEPPVLPRNAEAVPLEPSQTVEQAGCAVLRECLAQVAANVIAARELDDAECVHQLRVGLRRLRSAFGVFSLPFGGPAMTALNEEAKWLGQEAGAMRDLDVASTEILEPAARAHPEVPGLAELARRIADEAVAHRAVLRKVLADQRTQTFLIDLARFVETRGWLDRGDLDQSARLAEPVGIYAGTALAKRWKKVRKAGRGFDELSDEARHELRKELKKLRYAVEFMAPLFPEKKVKSFVADIKRMQDTFGSINDAAMVRQMFAAELDGPPLEQRAIGWITGTSHARAEHAWEAAKPRWDGLRDARRFWE